jgi:acyl carrier protein
MSNLNQRPDLISQVSRVIAENLLLEVNSPEENLLSSGAIDSSSLIQLLVSLEEYFGVRIPLDELEIEDLRSIQSIARLIEDYRHAAATTAGAGWPRSGLSVARGGEVWGSAKEEEETPKPTRKL